MFGPDIGTLNVLTQLVSENLNDIRSTIVWTKSGSQGNQWLQGFQTLNNLNGTNTYGWRAAFEGVVGKSFLGDIALDDIFLSQAACPTSRGCDFELSLCDYQATPDGSWIRQQATNINYFINQDHTSMTSLGYFAMAAQDNARYERKTNEEH
jgi:hypothetical protein